ncbi:Hypothetical predicted protein [Octopus vulgaris]|uniref:Uncharacterized protein n=2 Tax=Octopus TaxID=6643 RepID=A0AA36AMY4_OCTVU|nr:fukutin-related protein-like [Octopus sinensis]XP_036369526.1 fukutin-related protein-like [Octopus sinensis]CAI9718391.1 Hypothetical predicted protein [Octopus vulgaris]
MRAICLLTRCQILLFIGLLVNIVILLYLLKVQNDLQYGRPQVQYKNKVEKVQYAEFTDSVTLIIREFEDFENYVVATLKGILGIIPDLQVLVFTDHQPYPPLLLNEVPNARLVVLHPSAEQSWSSSLPHTYIKTPFLLIIPDAVKLVDPHSLLSAFNYLKQHSYLSSVALVTGRDHSSCLNLHVDLRRWTLTYENTGLFQECDAVSGEHAILTRSDKFLEFPFSFLQPMTTGFYIQAALRDWKSIIFKDSIFVGNPNLFSDPHKKWKHKKQVAVRLKNLYKQLRIKKVVLPGDGHVMWYGCTKETTRCFGTVVSDMPEYIYEGKWTPPCCLEAVRTTSRHVFQILEDCKVRYWLEGGSLLGAARSGDIIPWDYDVDIGIYKEDIGKCQPLVECEKEKFVDPEGFLWEKATEGDFFRVQYSSSNHMHVDIFPFYSKNSTMTKDTWIPGHRQDTEFPEKYLNPLTKVPFAGSMASAPNNVREFLEFKFGEGVIENPRYPNSNRVIR